MKQQSPRQVLCVSSGMPGIAWRPEDAARVFQLLAKPVVIAAAISLLVASLLLAGRSLAPFIIVEGSGNPAYFSTRTPQQAAEERALQSEMERLLARFESVEPLSTSELP